jgi:hexosaminidase
LKHRLCLFAAAILFGAVARAELNVVPAVQSWEPLPGTFSAKGARLVVDTDSATELDGVAENLKQELKGLGCGNFPIAHATNSGEGEIFLTISKTSPPGDSHNKEGYWLLIGNDVRIIASSSTGVFYGTRTLLQLLAQDKTNLTLPCGIIADYPQYPHRMLMLDVGRKPFPMSVLKDYLRLMSWYKMNELHLHLSDEAFGGEYTGFRVQSDTFPGLTSKDLFYTKKELREFQDLAHSLGITVTPEIDMPGHARVFTDYWPDLWLKGNSRDYLDVTNPQTIERLKRLLDEMIPIFDAPDFHIGTDEYRVGGTKEEKEKLHEAFRQFINTMNAHIRSKGKNCRIWSGFENMGGTTDVDPTVTIDMWETRDARGLIAKGHNVINSSDGRTYIVPGAHYYGVSNGGIYNSWEPWMISGDPARNPSKDDPHLLGGKLHVWNDHGPTGYTMTEIADLTLPSLQAFAEKLWGTKGSADYSDFQKRAALTQPVPGVAVFDRLSSKYVDGLLLEMPVELSLVTTNSTLPFPFARQPRHDLEYPWTLTLEIC